MRFASQVRLPDCLPCAALAAAAQPVAAAAQPVAAALALAAAALALALAALALAAAALALALAATALAAAAAVLVHEYDELSARGCRALCPDPDRFQYQGAALGVAQQQLGYRMR